MVHGLALSCPQRGLIERGVYCLRLGSKGTSDGPIPSAKESADRRSLCDTSHKMAIVSRADRNSPKCPTNACRPARPLDSLTLAQGLPPALFPR